MEIAKAKNCFKKFLYRFGILGLYHILKNRDTITVAMFHHVAPKRQKKNDLWNITPETFEECLKFFVKNYNIIGIDELKSHRKRKNMLPQRSLLITFDDGWGDNEEYALPILKKYSIPATVFVIAEQVGSEGIISNSNIPKIDKINSKSNVFLTKAQINNLLNSKITIGCHGLTHRPLTIVEDLNCETSEAKTLIASKTNINVDNINSFSLPHGIYDYNVIEFILKSGFEFIFSSEQCINSIKLIDNPKNLLGRIVIFEEFCTDYRGRFIPEYLGISLFMHKIKGKNMNFLRTVRLRFSDLA